MTLIIKRCFDLLLVVIFLPFWLVGMLAVGFLVRVFLGRSVFFKQTRIGYLERPFTMVKFRTMSHARDAVGELLPDGERLTRFGRWLRISSLDELPELINIVRGEMSFVGPRPLLPEYLPRYSAEQRRRHRVMPGITGWAQIKGRNKLSWQERLALDVEYVDRASFMFDMMILLRTIPVWLTGRGVKESEAVTSSPFLGSEQEVGRRKQ